jgi:DNA-binding transcriptional regulator YdaS (Cro superfamily)
MDSGIQSAILAAGSQEVLARALGVTQQSVSSWLVQGWVPMARSIEIEALYGIARARLVNPRISSALDTSCAL